VTTCPVRKAHALQSTLLTLMYLPAWIQTPSNAPGGGATVTADGNSSSNTRASGVPKSTGDTTGDPASVPVPSPSTSTRAASSPEQSSSFSSALSHTNQIAIGVGVGIGVPVLAIVLLIWLCPNPLGRFFKNEPKQQPATVDSKPELAAPLPPLGGPNHQYADTGYLQHQQQYQHQHQSQNQPYEMWATPASQEMQGTSLDWKHKTGELAGHHSQPYYQRDS
jgi:hypothetical protein